MQVCVFNALLRPESLKAFEDRANAKEAVSATTDRILPKFEEALWSAWRRKEHDYECLDDIDLFQKFTEFIERHYFDTI